MPEETSKQSLAFILRCPNHLSWLLTMQRSSGSVSRLSRIIELSLPQRETSHPAEKPHCICTSFFLLLFKAREDLSEDKLWVLLYSSALTSPTHALQRLPVDAPNWWSIYQLSLHNTSSELLYLWQLLPPHPDWAMHLFLLHIQPSNLYTEHWRSQPFEAKSRASSAKGRNGTSVTKCHISHICICI